MSQKNVLHEILKKGQFCRSKSEEKDPYLITYLIGKAEGFKGRPPAEAMQFVNLVLQSLVSP